MKKYVSILLICFLLLGITVPAFASTNTVVPPNLDPSQYDSYLIYRDNKDYVCILYLDADWELYAHDSYLDNETFVGFRMYASRSTPYVMYKATVPISNYDSSTSNNGWGTFSQVSGAGYGHETDSEGNRRPLYSFSLTRSVSEIIDCTQSIYYGHLDDSSDYVVYTDNVFFYQPLTLTMATGKALNQFQTQTFQTIAIIVLCGVGFLALLIGLSLFRKVLLRFLSK